jgi:spore cortex biosynthesis protein YabQ
MSPDIVLELKGVATSCLCGALITVVYDGIRIFRRLISHGNFWIGAEDFVFWMWTAIWIFSVLYRENDGNLRMYTMISMAIGMILYHKIISEPLVGVLGRWIKKLKKGIRALIMKVTWRKKHGNKDES